MYGDDISVFDAVEPDEFASHLSNRAVHFAKHAHWDLAGDLATASSIILGLLSRIEDLEADIDDFKAQGQRYDI